MFTTFIALLSSAASAGSDLPPVTPCAFEQSMVDIQEEAHESLVSQLDMMRSIEAEEQHLHLEVARHMRVGNALINEAGQLLEQMSPVGDPAIFDAVQLLEARADHHFATAEQFQSMMAVQPGDIDHLKSLIQAVDIRLDEAWMMLEACEQGDPVANW